MDGQMQCVQLCFPWNCKMMTSLKAKGRLKDDYIKPKGWTILDLFIFDLKTLLLFCDWKTSSLVQKKTYWLHSCKESCQQKKDLDHSNKQTKIRLIWARRKKRLLKFKNIAQKRLTDWVLDGTSSHELDYLNKFKEMLDHKGHQNSISGSKVTHMCLAPFYLALELSLLLGPVQNHNLHSRGL